MQNNQKIPEGWSIKRLGDICLFSSGGTPSKSKKEYWNNGTIKWLSAKYIDNNKVCGYDLITDAGKVACKIAHKGDIILVTRVSVGKLLFCNEDFAVNQDLTIIHTTKMMPLYLFNVLMKKNQEIIDKSQGLAIKGITKEALSDILFLLPPLAEQEKIAGILGTWDEAIEKLSALIEQKKLLKKGLMQKLLTGKTRLPSFTQPWKEVKLGEIADLYQPQTISQEMLVDSGYPVYGANGFIGYFSECNHKTWQIMVTCRGSTCGTVNRTKGPSWITGNAMVINCDNHDICKIFLYYKLLTERFSSVISGSGQPQIVRSPLLKWKICVPSDISEQQAIADVLSTADDEINLLNQKLEALKEQKKGLMQQLLTGQIRVKVN